MEVDTKFKIQQKIMLFEILLFSYMMITFVIGT